MPTLLPLPIVWGRLLSSIRAVVTTTATHNYGRIAATWWGCSWWRASQSASHLAPSGMYKGRSRRRRTPACTPAAGQRCTWASTAHDVKTWDGGSQYCIIHLWNRWVYVQAHLLTSPCRAWKPSFWGSAAGRSQRRWRSRSWGMSPQHVACATWPMTRRQVPTTLCMGGGHHRHGSFTIAASASIPWVQ